MPVDRYRNELRAAGWTWNERDRSNGKHRKERTESRAAKRSSRQQDKYEFLEQSNDASWLSEMMYLEAECRYDDETEVAHDSTPVKP